MLEDGRPQPRPCGKGNPFLYKRSVSATCSTSCPCSCEDSSQAAFVMWRVFCLSSLWILGFTIGAQEYLPPKAGGKKAAPEPTLPANYNFSYDVQESSATLDFGHNEKRKDDKVQGSYHVLLPDGRMQLVEYEAGPDGYKPLVMYMGMATYPEAKSDKFDGYHYNAASNRQSVRQPAPRGAARLATSQPPTSLPTHAPTIHQPPTNST